MNSWSRNSFRVAVPGQHSHRCMMHLLLSMLQTIFLIRSLCIMFQSITSNTKKNFWWAVQTQIEWVIFHPVRTHHLGLMAQNIAKPIFPFGCFYLKAVYNSCKLQRLLQDAKFLIMYSFTHTNIVFLFRHLPTEIVIFIKVCCQIKCFSNDSFSIFRSKVLLISHLFFDFMWSSNKVLKESKIFWTVHSRPFIRYQGKNLDLFWIWCCFRFFLHCLVQPNQDIHFLLHVIFIIRIRFWIIQTVNLYFLCFWNIAL